MILITDVYTWLFAWLMVMPRALGLFLLLPFAGRTILPGMARNALLISMTIILVPSMIEQVSSLPASLENIFLMILKEVFLGLLLGFIFGLPFWAMDSVGSLIDRQRGVMSGTVASPLSGSQTTILGNALSLYSVALLFASGGFYFLFETFLLSYQAWPVATFYPNINIEMSTYFLRLFDNLMFMILLISGPILIVIFLVDLGFGFLNRSVPQINVFILSLPVKGIASILILALYLTSISNYLKGLFAKYEASFRGLESLLQ